MNNSYNMNNITNSASFELMTISYNYFKFDQQPSQARARQSKEFNGISRQNFKAKLSWKHDIPTMVTLKAGEKFSMVIRAIISVQAWNVSMKFFLVSCIHGNNGGAKTRGSIP